MPPAVHGVASAPTSDAHATTAGVAAAAAAFPATGYPYPSFPSAFPYSPYGFAPYPMPSVPTVAGVSLNLPTIPNTLFVGNLASSVSSELLEQVFSQFGTVTQVKYMKERHYAFITYGQPKDATWAKANTNGLVLEGRTIRVSWGKEGAVGAKPVEDDNEDFFAAAAQLLPPPTRLVAPDYVPASDAVPEGSDLEVDATLFVGNLAMSVTVHILQNLYKQFGRIKNTRVNSEKHFGFVTFVCLEDAETAKAATDGFTLEGRQIRVNWGNKQAQFQGATQAQPGQ